MKFSKSDVRAFKKIEKSKYAIGASAIICLTESVYKIDENVYALPITTI